MLLQAAGANPGPVFLVANALTGLANTAADVIWGGALDATDGAALAICSTQAIIVALFAYYLTTLIRKTDNKILRIRLKTK